MSTVIFSIPNISCHHCIHTIQSEVSELEGVQSVVADLMSKTVKIEYSSPASEDSIKKLLSKIEYPVVG
jgi:copper chaperone CopZ